jgi:tRNA-dihydrouridine synthase
LARFLNTSELPTAPDIRQQYRLIAELYDDILIHYGSFLGVRHARKHLGWWLDRAAATAGVSADSLKRHRALLLTAEQPEAVRRRLAEAYDAFAAIGAARRPRSTAERMAA